jgi:hypothetical protein
LEDGRWKMEVGSLKMEDGRWKIEVGSFEISKSQRIQLLQKLVFNEKTK